MTIRGWLITFVALGQGCASLSSADHREDPSVALSAGRDVASDASDQSLGLGRESQRLQALRALEGLEPSRQSDVQDARWTEGLAVPSLTTRWPDEVRLQVEYYTQSVDGRSWMTAQLKRMGRYDSAILKVLHEEGLPSDLLYVAMVESGFNPKARSPRGAVGLWQLMPQVAQTYKLEMTHWVDYRMAPAESTRAAARLLRDLHERMGSWELALAAYNMGYSALLSSIQKYNSNDFWHLARTEAGLPYETGTYVPKILACAIIAKNAQHFGLLPAERDRLPESKKVFVPGGVELAALAEAGSVDKATLEALNPELRRGRVPVERDQWPLRVPASSYAILVSKLDALKRDNNNSAASLAGLSGYRVRLGDDIDDLAYRFRTTPKQLQTWNSLKKTETLEPGATLMVPRVQPRPSRPPEALAVTVPETPSVSRWLTKANRLQRIFYRVAPGDSWSRIAQYLSLKPSQIREWNTLDAAADLQAGMVLQLYVPKTQDLSRVRYFTDDEVKVLGQGSEAFFAHHELKKGRRRSKYTVREGDTLQSVGAKVGLSSGSLARINRIAPNANLQAGQTLIVYESLEPPAADARRSSEVASGGADGAPASASSTSSRTTSISGDSADSSAAAHVAPTSDAADPSGAPGRSDSETSASNATASEPPPPLPVEPTEPTEPGGAEATPKPVEPEPKPVESSLGEALHDDSPMLDSTPR